MTKPRLRLIVLITAVLTAAAMAIPPLAEANDEMFAPLDQPGPDLEAPQHELDAAFRCFDDLTAATVDPVLLVPGTTLSTKRNYEWNWLPALRTAGLPVCTVELHEYGMADIQRSVENIVHAVRSMHETSGRQVRIIGYSQGGLVPRFGIRFWPEVRDVVSELITLGGVHNGSSIVDPMCLTGCGPSLHQMAPSSDIVAATNSRQLVFDTIDFTSIYSRTDGLAIPSHDGTSSSVEGATNIALQDICPTNVADHIRLGTTDPVAYAVAVDALTHPGTADPQRIATNVCTEGFLPGVNPVTAPFRLTELMIEAADALYTGPHGYLSGNTVAEEPPLRCYVTATCASDSPGRSNPQRHR